MTLKAPSRAIVVGCPSESPHVGLPLIEGQIVGRRAWWVNGSELLSLTMEPWKVGSNRAHCSVLDCQYCDHLDYSSVDCTFCYPPDPGCTCGFHAFYDYPGGEGHEGQGIIHGIMTGWGRVELHPDGFRARCARVAALVGRGKQVNHLARRYGVPVITRDEFVDDTFITQFGVIVPENLRPAEIMSVG